MTIFTPQHNIFNEYSALSDIITKVLIQFVGERVQALDSWLQGALPIINAFFMSQMGRFTIATVDPELLKTYFSI